MAFKEAWEVSNETKDRSIPKELAKVYVDEHRGELFETLGRMNIPDLVKLVDALRAQGMEEQRLIVDMWLLSEHEPQDIRTTINFQGSEAIQQAMQALSGGAVRGVK